MSMVETITPVVHGGRRSAYRLSVLVHVLGAAVSAAALGAALGAVGWLLGAPWGAVGIWLVAGIAGLYVFREALGVPIPLPDRRRQVPEWWRTFYEPTTAALLYGLGLGVGYLTHLTFGTFVPVTVGAVATGDPLVGAALCVPFGLARSAAVLTNRNVADGDGPSMIVDRLGVLGATRGPRLMNATMLGLVAAVALAAR